MVQLIAVSHSFVLLDVSVGAAFDGDVRVPPRSTPAEQHQRIVARRINYGEARRRGW